MNTLKTTFTVTFTATLTALLLSLVSIVSYAHDGHDHDGPSLFQPQKGGVVKSVEEINVEVVTKDSKTEIYFYDNDGKIKEAGSFQASAEAKLPRSKTVEKLTLHPITDASTKAVTHYEINYDPKGTHRYTLVLNIKELKHKHSDKLQFTIETKKK